MDSTLDKGASGPLWLKDPAIASCVVEAIHHGEQNLSFYALHAYVVMPNHVHLLITPKVTISRITNGLKGVSARNANVILHRTNQHFWQDESFDHWVRSPAQFNQIRAYIENNPVSAGLTTHPKNWPWSSAFEAQRLRQTQQVASIPPR